VWQRGRLGRTCAVHPGGVDLRPADKDRVTRISPRPLLDCEPVPGKELSKQPRAAYQFCRSPIDGGCEQGGTDEAHLMYHRAPVLRTIPEVPKP
jgi:hypothetical protein